MKIEDRGRRNRTNSIRKILFHTAVMGAAGSVLTNKYAEGYGEKDTMVAV